MNFSYRWVVQKFLFTAMILIKLNRNYLYSLGKIMVSGEIGLVQVLFLTPQRCRKPWLRRNAALIQLCVGLLLPWKNLTSLVVVALCAVFLGCFLGTVAHVPPACFLFTSKAFGLHCSDMNTFVILSAIVECKDIPCHPIWKGERGQRAKYWGL